MERKDGILRGNRRNCIVLLNYNYLIIILFYFRLLFSIFYLNHVLGSPHFACPHFGIPHFECPNSAVRTPGFYHSHTKIYILSTQVDATNP